MCNISQQGNATSSYGHATATDLGGIGGLAVKIAAFGVALLQMI